MTSTAQPTPTTTGVSEALRAYAEASKGKACPICGGTESCDHTVKERLRAALSTAPAGDGVPGMAKSALDCVVHALMVLPVPIDGQGKRAWASLLEAQTILEALSTASTAGKG